DREGEPLGGATARHRTYTHAHLPEIHVGRRDRKVARKVELVPAAHRDAVEPRDGRLPAPQEGFYGSLEEPHVLPVVPGTLGVPLGILADVPAGAEGGGSRAREDDHADRVVERCVFDRAGELEQGARGVGIVDLGAIEHDTGDAVALLVEDVLEAHSPRWHRRENVRHLPGGGRPRARFRHPTLSESWRRVVDEARYPVPVRGQPSRREI